MKVTILTLDTPNLNGRTYPREVVEKAFLTLDERKCYIASKCGASPHINVEHICGKMNDLRIEENCLVGDVQLIGTLPACDPMFETLLSNGELAVRPSGMCTLSSDGVIGTDYTVNHFFLTNDPA